MKKIIILITCIVPIMAFTAPAAVLSGDVTFTKEENTLHIHQGSDKAILNWQDFSINAEKTVNFIQPSETSAILNRVLGEKPSEIYGTLSSNGIVYLVNQNGIIVGPDANINTGSFVASTLKLSDADFLHSSQINFKGHSNKSIINMGTIKALNGNVFFVAHTIENKGAIQAPKGHIDLAGGNTEVLLIEEGPVRISVQGTYGMINNQGSLEAIEIELAAVGNNIYSLAINQSGVVKATGIEERNGKVTLSGSATVSGTLHAVNANNSGGSIAISGEEIILENRGTVDASGKNGGDISLKGDTVMIASDTAIKALGLEGSEGGNIQIYANDVYIKGIVDVTSEEFIEKGWFTSSIKVGSAGDVKIIAQNDLSITNEIDGFDR
jgi:trimeric autotransporter adhesin